MAGFRVLEAATVRPSRCRLAAAAIIVLTAGAVSVGAAPAGAAVISTTATAGASPQTVTYGNQVTYSMDVTSSTGPNPTGTSPDVTFSAGNTLLCEATISSGTASCSSTNAPGGSDTIQAAYFGNATWASATATTTLTVNVTPPAAPAGATSTTSATGVGTSFTADLGDLHVQANGAGAVTLATYGSDPTSSPPVGATNVYDDVAIGRGSSLDNITIAVCDYGSGRSLQWYDAATSSWDELSVQSRNIACLFATVSGTTSPTLTQLVGTPIAVSVLTPPSAAQGYWLVARDGGIFSYDRPFFGSTGGIALNKPIVGMATTNDEKGYWMVAADGGVFAFGDAPYLGSLPSRGVNVSNIVAMVSDPSTDGYYLIGSDGSVWNFNAPQLGDLPFFGFHVSDIVGAALTPSDNGMYLVGADGKVYVLVGDGHFQGDASGIRLNAPIVAMAVDPVTGGYWLLGRDGGVFSYGAPFYGSTGALKLNQPVITMAATGDGGGYWFTALDGGVFSYGDAQFWGSTGAIRLNQPVLGMSGS
ncbi:MAG TPA: Ig-like domain-containing protein [Acidimicrobiales bacterium]|jgi:hypothetical protein|nr:Ig-like domain-containing protein [Acidimicrobiales bacterium]